LIYAISIGGGKAEMKVFVGNDHRVLYVGGGFEKPMLIGYVYEYEAEEEDVKYWNSLKPEDKETIFDKAQLRKRDIRLLIREKRQKS
jgi:hypothetical protein